MKKILWGLACVLAALGCSSASAVEDAAAPVDLGTSDAMPADAGEEGVEAIRVIDDHFVMRVVSFTPGPCAGFGQEQMPDVIRGAPRGGGALRGSLDVVSLGVEGEIVVSFEPNAIVDGEGADFIVFENVFFAQGDESKPVAEVGEVSASEDGETWKTFPCSGPTPPYGTCAGWHPSYSSWENEISPRDPSVAGGEAFDLALIGLSKARFVRIRDKSGAVCENGINTAGFDLDAVAIVHAELSE